MSLEIVKKIEHLFKDALHIPFSLFLGKGNSSRYPVNPEKIKSILFLRPDKLGDMIVTIPVFHAIKQKYPHIRIEVMASPLNKSVIENDPQISQVHIYSKNILKDWPLINRLKKKRFDIIFDPIVQDSITGLLLSKLIENNSVIVGARKSRLQKYYDYCEPYHPDGDDHNIDNSFLIFNIFGIKPETIDPFQPVYIPADSQDKADKYFKTLPGDTHFQIIVNISAGSPSRTLASDTYQVIIDSINDKYPQFKFIISCTMKDRGRAEEIISNLKTDCFLVPENLSLLDISAIIGQSDMLISPDTSIIHIAGLMKIPVVGLYSNCERNLNSWRPYRQKYGAVVSGNMYNLHDIEPKQVVDEFCCLLNTLDSMVSKKIEREHY